MSTSFSRRLSFRLALALALTFSLAAGSWPRPRLTASPPVHGKSDAPAQVPAKTNAEIEQRAKDAYGKLGVSFEENRGQVDGKVRFLARRGGATVYLTNEEASFVLSAPEPRDRAADESSAPEAPAQRGRVPGRRVRPKSHTVRMKFEGANPWAEVVGEHELEGKINYFRGSDPSKWRAGVRTYGAVRYRGIYDGIDLVYYGNEAGQMEYDFVVAPGADPRRISLKVEGAKALKVDAAGDLVIGTAAGEMRQHKPLVYQEAGGARRAVEGRYVVTAGGRVRFKLGEYDRSAPLVIDPVLDYSTYLSGSDTDEGLAIAVDPSGNAYVTGVTFSNNFTRVHAIQGTFGGGGRDAFVAKLNAAGTALVYSTYLGGSREEYGYGIAADSSGNAYVTGYTDSPDFPTANALPGQGGASQDAFVTKLNPDGSALVYSTYLGGSESDLGGDIEVDSAGNAYVAGSTFSRDFPTVNPVQSSNHGLEDVFVTKLNAAGSALVYSTYLGGFTYDKCRDLAVDSSGNAYVTGLTYSPNFPTVNAFKGEKDGIDEAFVTKLNAAGSAFVYSTYLGGSAQDEGRGIAVDSAGNAYVAGWTSSTDFPTKNPIRGTLVGGGDGFVTKLNPDGSALVYSTYLGGGQVAGIAVDSSGNAYVTGYTGTPDFPTTANAFQSENAGKDDAFVTKLNAAGSALVYSTYLGGRNFDRGVDIAVDSSGSVYLTGRTDSYNFPTAHPVRGPLGSADVFVTKIGFRGIRGRVVTRGAAGPVGVPWVTVRLTGAQTLTRLTDAHGYYSFPGLEPGGDYTVSPVKNNLSFTPASRTFNELLTDVSDADFTVPSLSVNDVIVTEGDAGEATATFTVKLQPASTKPVTVSYQTADGTISPAAAGSDYTALPLTQLTFAPGQTAKAVTVKVRGDTVDEPDETFRLLLSTPTNALISDKEGVCVVNDNDAAPSLSVNNVAVTEGDSDVAATFTVTLSAASAQTLTVKYKTANGTATAPADYTAAGLKTLTFAPGEATKTVSVTVKGDELDEPAETFQLQLSPPTNATIADGIGVCTITDDD